MDSHQRLNRWPAGLVAALVMALTVSTGIGPTADAGEPADGGGLDEFYQQRPAWEPCAPELDLECATILVPLDYDQPDGQRITVAISRRAADDPARRRGVLLLNPGGPGGSGLYLPYQFQQRPIAEVYDLVGFDPRGVGRSTPLQCEVVPGDIAALSTRPTEDELVEFTNLARNIEDGCERSGGGLRPYVNTSNTARDMDVIRGVLGEADINYLGFSYGTYLGAVYGELFPAHVDRTVLDSSVHPDWIWRQAFQEQAKALRESVDDLAGWLGDRNRTYGLGGSHDEVMASIEAIAAQLAETPLEEGVVDRSYFDTFLGLNARYRPMWDQLGGVLVNLRDALDGTAATDSPPVVDALNAARLLYDLGIKQTVNDIFNTVTCEVPWPRDLETYHSDMRLYRERYPYGFGVYRTAPFACTFAEFAPSAPPPADLTRDYPVGLVVQAEKDGQTAYAGGPAMAATLRNQLISVADDGTHGLYVSNPCVQRIVDSYLVDGVLPGSSVVCPGDPRPDVPEDGAGSAGSAGDGGGSLEQAVAHFIRTKELVIFL